MDTAINHERKLKREVSKQYKWWHVLPPAALVVVTGCVFAHTCSYGFVGNWDDAAYVTNNGAHLQMSPENVCYWFGHTCVAAYGPLTMFSFMLDYAVWGLNPFGYHLHNLVLHLIVILGFYYCLREFRFTRFVAFVMALFVAVHPQRLEAVVWISERKEVMGAAFYIWSVFFYIRFRNSGRQWLFFVSLLAFIVAILAKPMAVSLPVVLLFYEFHKERRFCSAMMVKRLVPYFVIVSIIIPVTIYVQPSRPGGITLLGQIWIVAHNLCWYPLKTFLPTDLCPIYPEVRPHLSCAVHFVLLVAIVVLLIIWARRCTEHDLRFDILPLPVVCLVVLLPIIGVFPLGAAIDYADRYSYLPSLFIVFSLGCLCVAVLEPWHAAKFGGNDAVTGRRIRLMWCGAMLSMVFVWMPITLMLSNTWSSYYNVMKAASLHEPANGVGLWNLARLEIRRGRYEQAMVAALRLKKVQVRAGINNSARSVFLQAYILSEIGQYGESNVLFMEILPALRYDPKLRTLHRQALKRVVANCLFLDERALGFEKTEELLNVLKMDDTFDYMYSTAAHHYFGREYVKALSETETLLKQFPDSPGAEFLLEKCQKKIAHQ